MTSGKVYSTNFVGDHTLKIVCCVFLFMRAVVSNASRLIATLDNSYANPSTDSS